MTFTYPAELVVLLTRLDAEGIECRVLDEFTVQVNPFYSNAIGGIKLQVRERDVYKAIEILKTGGYLKEEHRLSAKRRNKFNDFSSRIPLLKKLQPELRLIIFVAIISILILTPIIIIYFATLPSTYERLTKRSWCVDHIVYNKEAYIPNTVTQFQLFIAGFCQETIMLNANGTLTLPGFDSHAASGKWEFNNERLQISEIDTFSYVYNGIFDVKFSKGKLILSSPQTIIYCYPQNTYLKSPYLKTKN